MDNRIPTMNNKVDESSQNAEKSTKPITPPTAVVVPVVHNQKERNIPLNTSKKKKRKKSKRANPKETKVSEIIEEEGNKKRKRLLPLNKSNSEDISCGKDNASTSLKAVTAKQTVTDDYPKAESSENSVKDIEMRDVSMDLLDDLTEKKETVFDVSACYYIVIDTNVLIGEVHLINELIDTPLDGCGPPHMFIPWVVIEELDKLKSQRNTKNTSRAACEAIRYLNSVLGKHPRFHGQSPAEAQEWAKAYSKCNDDKVLECCMALQDKMSAEKVILLTNDKNLVNKARICNINVHNFESMMKKVKPDTVFNYKELKMNKTKRKEKVIVDLKSPLVTSNTIKEQILQNKRDVCKRQIHSIMSNARLLLKNVLSEFLSKEMYDAYGDIWLKFKIELNLLRGILEAVEKYWVAVFSLFFSEKDRRNFELLLKKARRPEGFLGDKDECLITLSAIEDVFRQVQRRRPNIKVSVEQIQDYRVACVNTFATYSEAERSIQEAEETSIRTLLDANWNAINQLCGIILDYYEVPHDFSYEKIDQTLPDFEIRRIMSILYPAVQQFKKLLQNIDNAIKQSKPVKVYIKKLTAILINFIPSLRLRYEPINNSFFNQKAVESFFTSPQNRKLIEIGTEQIERFYTKLDEVLCIMLLPQSRNQSPESETMICD